MYACMHVWFALVSLVSLVWFPLRCVCFLTCPSFVAFSAKANITNQPELIANRAFAHAQAFCMGSILAARNFHVIHILPREIPYKGNPSICRATPCTRQPLLRGSTL